MFALVVVLLCDFLIKVRSHEFSNSDRSLKDYASIRSFFVNARQFSWPYGLQAKPSFDKFQFPGLQHLKGASRRLPRMYVHVERKKPVDYPPYWMSYSDPPVSASTKMAVVKPLPYMFYTKPKHFRFAQGFANAEKLPSVAMSSMVEKKVPFFVDKPKFPMTAEQFMQEKYGMLTEKTVIEKPVPFPFTVEKYVPYAVEKPYPVEKHVPYPVEKLVPYPVPVPVRTPMEIPVPVPMVTFDPVFIPVGEAENRVALWMRQNVTEAKDLNPESSNLFTTELLGQTGSTGHLQISPTNTHLPANTSLVIALPTQLLDASRADSQFASSENGETTELSRPSASSLPSP